MKKLRFQIIKESTILNIFFISNLNINQNVKAKYVLLWLQH